MPDVEKVVKGLECCIKRDPDDKTRCGECPYEGACLNRLKSDALTLLKAQEAVKPYAEYSEHTGTKWLVCGACNEPMNKVKEETWSNYCPNCGRKVKYE